MKYAGGILHIYTTYDLKVSRSSQRFKNTNLRLWRSMACAILLNQFVIVRNIGKEGITARLQIDPAAVMFHPV